MKSLTKLIFLSTLLLYTIESKSQDARDLAGTALDLSRATPGGSARILGLGETQTALGGDVSSISGNPAGLGFFNRSEVSLSTTFNYLSSTSKYLGSATDDARLNLNFGNLGVIIKNSKGKGLYKGGAFGISINRIADFQNQITYEGSSTTDFIDYAVYTDNFGDQNDLTDLAFETYLTDQFYVIYQGQQTISINGFDEKISELYPGATFNNGDTLFFVDRNIYRLDDGSLGFPDSQNPTFQSENIKSTGATYQTSFAYGGNYNDRLYFGGNIGILTMSKSVERRYTERPTNADLNGLLLEDNYDLTGSGVVATIGFIGRPVNPLLLGISYTTPSYYAIEQKRNITLTANYAGNDIKTYGFDYDPFNYVITTPSRLRLGATYFLSKYGFLTGDIEKINYAGAKLSNSDIDQSFTEENSTVNKYESVWNYRLGAEFRYDIFRLRGGFSYAADPVKNNYDQSESKISFGGGIRTENFYMDLAIINGLGRQSTISPYPGQDKAIVSNNNTGVTITAGIFF